MALMAAAGSEVEVGETDGEETGRPPSWPALIFLGVSMTWITWQKKLILDVDNLVKTWKNHSRLRKAYT